LTLLKRRHFHFLMAINAKQRGEMTASKSLTRNASAMMSYKFRKKGNINLLQSNIK
jgi:hypothetical protein